MKTTLPTGMEVALLPSRAVFCPRLDLLLVADTHLGKDEAFRALGQPVPEGSAQADLERLGAALDETGASHLVILGDFFHARAGRSSALEERVAAWRSRFAHVRMQLVRGNHDRHAGDPPGQWNIETHPPPLLFDDLALLHEPGTVPDRYTIAGHLHPAVRLRDRFRGSTRLPCFWMSPTGMVLPAFGSFTGNADIQPVLGDRVYVITPDGELAEVAGNSISRGSPL